MNNYPPSLKASDPHFASAAQPSEINIEMAQDRFLADAEKFAQWIAEQQYIERTPHDVKMIESRARFEYLSLKDEPLSSLIALVMSATNKDVLMWARDQLASRYLLAHASQVTDLAFDIAAECKEAT